MGIIMGNWVYTVWCWSQTGSSVMGRGRHRRGGARQSGDVWRGDQPFRVSGGHERFRPLSRDSDAVRYMHLPEYGWELPFVCVAKRIKIQVGGVVDTVKAVLMYIGLNVYLLSVYDFGWNEGRPYGVNVYSV